MHTTIGLSVETGAGVYCYTFDDRPPMLALIGHTFYLDVTGSPDDPDAQLDFARQLLDAATQFHAGTQRCLGRARATADGEAAA